MTITVNLTPIEEARLSTEAIQSGLEPEELVQKLLREHLVSSPTTSIEAARLKLRQWQKETDTDTFPVVSAHELFARWAEEDVDMTEEEIAADNRLWEEFQRGIDDERTKAGMRTVFSG